MRYDVCLDLADIRPPIEVKMLALATLGILYDSQYGNLRHGVSILQIEGQFGLSAAEMTASSTGWVSWIELITGRFLDRQ